MKEKNNSRGITLIALVVTIIVLLILAGITIAMLTGQNGILNRATEARDANGIAQIDEQVKLAVAEALSNGLGTITDKNLRAALDNNVGAGNYTLTGDATNGWTIIAGEKTYKINGNGDISGGDNTGGNTDGNTGGTTGDNDGTSIGGIYSESGITEDQIAPNDLFEYRILNNSSKTASNVNSNLPTKTARITRIKEQYCNHRKNDENGEELEGNTNYEIKYEGITDTLIIPYKVPLTNPETGKEEVYTITGVSLAFKSINGGWCRLPSIENIIYPNTVTDISIHDDDYSLPVSYLACVYSKLKKVVFSDNIEEIPAEFFSGYRQTNNYKGIEYVQLPKNLKKIGYRAFATCNNIKEITLPDSIEKIDERAFYEWENNQVILVSKEKKEVMTGLITSAKIKYIGEDDTGSGSELGSGSGSGSDLDSGSGSGSGSGSDLDSGSGSGSGSGM